jgi:hypothetical protein
MSNGWVSQLDIIEVEPMQEGLVTVDAAAMARDLDTTGSVALYGIHFDTGLAVHRECDVRVRGSPQHGHGPGHERQTLPRGLACWTAWSFHRGRRCQVTRQRRRPVRVGHFTATGAAN